MKQRVSSRILRREALALLLTSFAAAGCGPRRVMPPTAPSSGLLRPASAIPADLDVAVRVDLIQARRAFGDEIIEALEFDLGSAEDAAGAALLKTALRTADAVWIALRPGLAKELTDNVVILRGRFEALEPTEYVGRSRWQPALDLGAAWRLYERQPTPVRAAPVRLYARADDLLIFVSEAEMDSVERAIELRAGDEHLEPPDKGTVSLAMRVQPILRWIAYKYVEMAELLAAASQVLGHVSVDALGASAELEVQFVDATDAKLAADAAAVLLDRLGSAAGPYGTLARGAATSAVGTSAVVRVRLAPDQLADLVTSLP